MKKKAILFALVLAMMLSIVVPAYAAVFEYPMTYLSGTTDTVTNLPDADDGTGGEAYTVSSTIPQRAGYEFIDWTLDYEIMTIQTSYTVKYLEEETGMQLVQDKVVTDLSVGTPVTEKAIDIENYDLISDASQTKTLVQNAEENTITFYYKRSVTTVSYTVKYVNFLTDESIAEDKIVDGVLSGEHVVECALEIYGFTSMNAYYEWNVQGDDVIIFFYFPSLIA